MPIIRTLATGLYRRQDFQSISAEFPCTNQFHLMALLPRNIYPHSRKFPPRNPRDSRCLHSRADSYADWCCHDWSHYYTHTPARYGDYTGSENTCCRGFQVACSQAHMFILICMRSISLPGTICNYVLRLHIISLSVQLSCTSLCYISLS